MNFNRVEALRYAVDSALPPLHGLPCAAAAGLRDTVAALDHVRPLPPRAQAVPGPTTWPAWRTGAPAQGSGGSAPSDQPLLTVGLLTPTTSEVIRDADASPHNPTTPAASTPGHVKKHVAPTSQALPPPRLIELVFDGTEPGAAVEVDPFFDECVVAIEDRDLPELQRLLSTAEGDSRRSRFKHRLVDDHGWTLAHHAAACENVTALSVLLNNSVAELNARDHLGSTPLMLALSKGTPGGNAFATAVLDSGLADPNVRAAAGATALHLAIDMRAVTIAERLMEMGASPVLRARVKLRPAGVVALQSGQAMVHGATKDALQELLAVGADALDLARLTLSPDHPLLALLRHSDDDPNQPTTAGAEEEGHAVDTVLALKQLEARYNRRMMAAPKDIEQVQKEQRDELLAHMSTAAGSDYHTTDPDRENDPESQSAAAPMSRSHSGAPTVDASRAAAAASDAAAAEAFDGPMLSAVKRRAIAAALLEEAEARVKPNGHVPLSAMEDLMREMLAEDGDSDGGDSNDDEDPDRELVGHPRGIGVAIPRAVREAEDRYAKRKQRPRRFNGADITEVLLEISNISDVVVPPSTLRSSIASGRRHGADPAPHEGTRGSVVPSVKGAHGQRVASSVATGRFAGDASAVSGTGSALVSGDAAPFVPTDDRDTFRLTSVGEVAGPPQLPSPLDPAVVLTPNAPPPRNGPSGRSWSPGRNNSITSPVPRSDGGSTPSAPASFTQQRGVGIVDVLTARAADLGGGAAARLLISEHRAPVAYVGDFVSDGVVSARLSPAKRRKLHLYLQGLAQGADDISDAFLLLRYDDGGTADAPAGNGVFRLLAVAGNGALLYGTSASALAALVLLEAVAQDNSFATLPWSPSNGQRGGILNLDEAFHFALATGDPALLAPLADKGTFHDPRGIFERLLPMFRRHVAPASKPFLRQRQPLSVYAARYGLTLLLTTTCRIVGRPEDEASGVAGKDKAHAVMERVGSGTESVGASTTQAMEEYSHVPLVASFDGADGLGIAGLGDPSKITAPAVPAVFSGLQQSTAPGGKAASRLSDQRPPSLSQAVSGAVTQSAASPSPASVGRKRKGAPVCTAAHIVAAAQHGDVTALTGVLQNCGRDDSALSESESGAPIYAGPKAPINTLVDRRDTPLTAAIKAKQHHAVRLLLDHKADVNKCDGDGTPPLVLAAAVGDEMSCALLAPRVDLAVPGPGGVSALLAAVLGPTPSCATLLLHAGADAFQADDAGLTPLLAAQLTRHEALLQLLAGAPEIPPLPELPPIARCAACVLALETHLEQLDREMAAEKAVGDADAARRRAAEDEARKAEEAAAAAAAEGRTTKAGRAVRADLDALLGDRKMRKLLGEAGDRKDLVMPRTTDRADPAFVPHPNEALAVVPPSIVDGDDVSDLEGAASAAVTAVDDHTARTSPWLPALMRAHVQLQSSVVRRLLLHPPPICPAAQAMRAATVDAWAAALQRLLEAVRAGPIHPLLPEPLALALLPATANACDMALTAFVAHHLGLSAVGKSATTPPGRAFASPHSATVQGAPDHRAQHDLLRHPIGPSAASGGGGDANTSADAALLLNAVMQLQGSMAGAATTVDGSAVDELRLSPIRARRPKEKTIAVRSSSASPPPGLPAVSHGRPASNPADRSARVGSHSPPRATHTAATPPSAPASPVIASPIRAAVGAGAPLPVKVAAAGPWTSAWERACGHHSRLLLPTSAVVDAVSAESGHTLLAAVTGHTWRHRLIARLLDPARTGTCSLLSYITAASLLLSTETTTHAEPVSPRNGLPPRPSPSDTALRATVATQSKQFAREAVDALFVLAQQKALAVHQPEVVLVHRMRRARPGSYIVALLCPDVSLAPECDTVSHGGRAGGSKTTLVRVFAKPPASKMGVARTDGNGLIITTFSTLYAAFDQVAQDTSLTAPRGFDLTSE